MEKKEVFNTKQCKECGDRKRLLAEKHTRLAKTKPNSKNHHKLEKEIDELNNNYRELC